MEEKESEERQGNIFVEISATIFSYWPAFVIGLSLAFACAYIYLRYTPAFYQANAKLLVKDDTKTGFGRANNVMNQLDAFGSKTNVENEMVTIRSRSIMREAAINANSFVTIYSNGRISDRIQPSFPVRFKPLVPDSLVGGIRDFSVTESELVFGENHFPLKDSVVIDVGLKTDFLVTVNENEISSVRNEKFVLHTKSLLSEVGALSGSFNAEATSKQASVIDLSITALDPKLAEAIVSRINPR